MRLYPGQAKSIARELCAKLIKDEAIEVETELLFDAEEDLDSVLMQYIRTDREITNDARDSIRERGLGNSAMGRIKRRLARERGFAVGDDAVDWLVEQLIEMIMYTNNIEEVYVEDRDLRRTINKVLRDHTEVENELVVQAKSKIKNLKEGSATWELEYERAMQNLKRQKGLL